MCIFAADLYLAVIFFDFNSDLDLKLRHRLLILHCTTATALNSKL